VTTARLPLDPQLQPAPPVELSSGSITGWLVLATVLALLVAGGLVLASRR
jgi:hypothetical protein